MLLSTLQASLLGTFLQTARTGYATKGALFIPMQLSTGAVSTLRKCLGTNKNVAARESIEACM